MIYEYCFLDFGMNIIGISELFMLFRKAEWDRAFNFSSNLEFLTSCIQKTNGMSSNLLEIIWSLSFSVFYIMCC